MERRDYYKTAIAEHVIDKRRLSHIGAPQNAEFPGAALGNVLVARCRRKEFRRQPLHQVFFRHILLYNYHDDLSRDGQLITLYKIYFVP